MRQTLDNQLALFLRKRRGQTSYDAFARKLGITPASLIDLENCQQSVTLKILQQILDQLPCGLTDVFPSETIPVDVKIAIGATALQVCEEAKLDFDEWPLRAHEAVTHLRERWRDGTYNGLSSVEAKRQVLDSYGDPLAVGKSWRKPWYFRVLFHERYRATRYLLFLFAYVLFSWLMVLDVHYRAALDTFNSKGREAAVQEIASSFNTLMLPFEPEIAGRVRYPPGGQILSSINPGFFVDGMGSFFTGLAALACVVIIRWRPKFRNSLLNHAFALRYPLVLVALFAIFMLAVWPTYLTWITFVHSEGDVFDQGYCVIHLSAMFLGWLGAACLVSELFDLPGIMRTRRDQKRPLAVVA